MKFTCPGARSGWQVLKHRETGEYVSSGKEQATEVEDYWRKKFGELPPQRDLDELRRLSPGTSRSGAFIRLDSSLMAQKPETRLTSPDTGRAVDPQRCDQPTAGDP